MEHLFAWSIVIETKTHRGDISGISLEPLSDAEISRVIEGFIIKHEIDDDVDDVEELVFVATSFNHDYVERLSPEIFWPIYPDGWLENKKRFRTSKGGEN